MKRIILVISAGLLWSTYGFAQPPQIYAPNGKYLGNLNENQFDPNSVNNPYGRYGSPYSPDSINNPYGRYGSPYSPDSPNNPYATGQPGHNRKFFPQDEDD
jgi:hypothetical protein